jgi:hypothetical protein
MHHSTFLAKLLRFNINFDRVKIGIDEDGNIVARIDLSVRILDDRELKESLLQLLSVADAVYQEIGSYMQVAC